MKANLKKREAKTELQHIVQGYYPGTGWEDLCASLSYKEARIDLEAYQQNAPGTAYRMIGRRVRKDS